MINQLIRKLSNLPGWRTNRRIVVIESDDWGSIRMPSLAVYRLLKEKGVNIDSGDNKRFNTLDTLASKADFEQLFHTLGHYQDRYGNLAVMTAMSLCANPDFERIKASDFQQYYYESFPTTLERYGRVGAFEMWKRGEQQGVFVPEFHGREHLNINVWMNALKVGDTDTLTAFEQGFWGFRQNKCIPYQSAFDVEVYEDVVKHKEIIRIGIALFEQIHGRKPVFFVPPNGAINQEVINYSGTQGIKWVSSSKIYKEPLGNEQYRKRFRYLGKKGKGEMRYLTRNCFFEPNYQGKGFSVDDCLNHIQTAFQFRKPAIISTHRVNYVGGLSEDNRRLGNKALAELLSRALERWPQLEFMTSVDLGKLITDDKK